MNKCNQIKDLLILILLRLLLEHFKLIADFLNKLVIYQAIISLI